MELNKLRQVYCNQLIRFGVDPQQSVRSSKQLTREDFQLISEIWPAWDRVIAQSDGIDAVPLDSV